MTIAEMNAACALTTIEALRLKGAEVLIPGRGRMGLNASVYEAAIAKCGEEGLSVLCYSFFLPGMEEDMLIAFLADGRLFAGSDRYIFDCLARS